MALSLCRVLTNVDIDVAKSGHLFLLDQTTGPVAACVETHAEVREIWSLVFRSEAEKRQGRRPSIISEDPEYRAQFYVCSGHRRKVD